MRSMHEVRPDAGRGTETEGLEEVVAYLLGRGLAADDQKAAELFGRLLRLPHRLPDQRVTVKRAAKHFYMSRRALGRWCRRTGLPTPSHVLAFGRVLRTMQAARTQDLTFATAARRTGWPDAFSMSNSLVHLTGLRPTEARTRGLVYVAEAWLRRELEEGNAQLREPRPPSCPSCGQEVSVARRG